MDRRPGCAEHLGHALAVQLILALLTLGILLGSCTEKDNVAHPVPDAAMHTPDAGPSAPFWPPTECEGLASPVGSEACLGGIRDVCRSHQDKQGCVRQGRVLAGDFPVSCNWVPLVTFTDDMNCVVQSSSWRCEGHIDLLLDACSDPCEVSPELHYAWKAIPSKREMIKMCGVPVGPWLFNGMGPMYAASCLPGREGVVPPNPPLCDCIPQACEVTRGMMADQF